MKRALVGLVVLVTLALWFFTSTTPTDREFVEPALRAVRHWRFEPGRRDGKAVPFRMTIPIEFSLEDAR